MHSPVTPTSPFLSLGCTPSRVTAGFTRLTLALFLGIKKKKKNNVHKHGCLFGGSEGEKKQESGRSGLIPVGGLAGEKPQGRRPGAACEPREPSAWHFLRAFRFLFCLRAKFCPFQQEGELKPAAFLLTGKVSSRRR